jgi:hypothetical protein
MAAVGDVGVELALAGREPLGVAGAVVDRHAAGHEQRAGLEEVAARLGGERVAGRVVEELVGRSGGFGERAVIDMVISAALPSRL